MMSLSNKKLIIFIGSFFLFFILQSTIKGYKIDHYGKTIIGKYIYQERFPKTQNDYFLYYLEGDRKINYINNRVWGGKDKMNKFFYIKYHDDYPEVIHPLFDNEVTDTLEIINSGFSKNDLVK